MDPDQGMALRPWLESLCQFDATEQQSKSIYCTVWKDSMYGIMCRRLFCKNIAKGYSNDLWMNAGHDRELYGWLQIMTGDFMDGYRS